MLDCRQNFPVSEFVRSDVLQQKYQQPFYKICTKKICSLQCMCLLRVIFRHKVIKVRQGREEMIVRQRHTLCDQGARAMLDENTGNVPPPTAESSWIQMSKTQHYYKSLISILKVYHKVLAVKRMSCMYSALQKCSFFLKLLYILSCYSNN